MKINSRIVLFKCFLPYAFSGAILCGLLHGINLNVPLLVLFIVKGFLFFFLYVVMSYCLLNKSDKVFLSKILMKK